MKLRRSIRIIPPIISAGLIYILLRKTGISELAMTLRQTSFRLLLIAFAINIPFILLKSCKWHRIAIMAVPDIRFSESVISFLTGLGASLFTPAQLGELARTVVFRENRRRVLFLTFVDKLTDLMALALLFGVSVFFMRRDMGAIFTLPGWLPFVNMAVRQRQELRVRFLISQLLLSIACFLVLMLQFYVILLNFTDVGFRDAAFALSVLTVAGMLPVTVGGLGLREMAASVILPGMGIDSVQAVGASLLFYFLNGLIPGLMGIILGWSRIH